MTDSKPSKRSKRTADDWLLAAIAAMADGGVEKVKVERLAKQLGTTKGSFYWHFKDRADLLDQLIHYWVEKGTQDVMKFVTDGPDNPADRLPALLARALHEPVGSLSSAQGEMAIRSWASTAPHIADIVARTDQTRVDYVTQLLRDLGQPAARAKTQAQQLYLMLLGFMRRRATPQARAMRQSGRCLPMSTF